MGLFEFRTEWMAETAGADTETTTNEFSRLKSLVWRSREEEIFESRLRVFRELMNENPSRHGRV
jgi:hypothetical protein